MSDQSSKELLIIGIGAMGSAVAAHALKQGYKVYGTTRSLNPGKVDALKSLGIEPVDLRFIEMADFAALAAGKPVLVTIPPDNSTDQAIAPYLKDASTVIYVSTTTIYGGTTGYIDETTEIPPRSHYSAWRLGAEDAWRSIGATVVRVSGFYSKGWGVHEDIRKGNFKLPGDGHRFVSFIHMDDLAAIYLSILEKQIRSETFLAADTQPVTQYELVSWLCEKLNVEMVPSIPEEQCHFSMLASRQINSQKVRDALAMTLKYPTYKDGFAAILADESSA